MLKISGIFGTLKMKFLTKAEWKAISLMIGTIIGAGILALPYAISKVGILLGVLLLAVIGFIVMILGLYMGEIVLRTKKIHEVAGYAEKYAGKWAKTVITLSMFVGIIGALVAYLIGEGEALYALFGWDKFYWSLLFFVVMAVFIFFDLKAIASFEKWFVGIMLIVLFAIMGFSLGKFDISNLMHFDLSKLLIPYGVILFAVSDVAVIPEVLGVLEKNKKALKKCVILGFLIPLIVYVLFSVIVVAVSGMNITEVATIGLGESVGKHVLLLGNLFAIIAMATSFLTLGLALKWILSKDYWWDDKIAWFVACSVPFLVFLTGIAGFVSAIRVTGAIAFGVEGIMIIFMFHNAKKKSERKPEYVIKPRLIFDVLIALLFVSGILWTVWSLF